MHPTCPNYDLLTMNSATTLMTSQSTEGRWIHSTCPAAELKRNVPSLVFGQLGAAALGAPPPLPTLYDASPAEELLGIRYRSVQEMTLTSVRSMFENGFTDSKAQYVPDK
jgi:hypothetical protein